MAVFLPTERLRFAFGGCMTSGVAMVARPLPASRSSPRPRRPRARPITTACRLVLEEGQFEDWMRDAPERAAELMNPYDGTIDVWEVGAAVGNVRNNQPELMERVA